MKSKNLDKRMTADQNLGEYREKVRLATLEILNQSNYKEILAKYSIAPENFIVRSSTVTSPEVKTNIVAKVNEIKLSVEDSKFSETGNVGKAIQDILTQSNYRQILKKYDIAEENYIIRSLVVTSPEVKSSLIEKTLPPPSFIPTTEITDTSFLGCSVCYFDDFGRWVCENCPCPC